MRPGDLWCLDTSYLHSVENGGNESRVHIVIECNINDRIRKHIPLGLRPKLHNIHYSILLLWDFFRAVVTNSLSDREYFRSQMSMVAKFIGWRLLGRDPVE